MDKTILQSHPFCLSLLSAEQFYALKAFAKEGQAFPLCRIYVAADLLLHHSEIVASCEELAEKYPETKWVISLPEILRAKDHEYLGEVLALIHAHPVFCGILSGTFEGIGYFEKYHEKVMLYGDHNLYLWNSSAVRAMSETLDGGCLPLELRGAEQKELLELPLDFDKVIYGRIPMMLTANCIAKTNGACRKYGDQEKPLAIEDRMGISFPVRTNCDHCYNVIYNSLPLSLHGFLDRYQGKAGLRISLSLEDYAETLAILRFFLNGRAEEQKPPVKDYTTGHEKRFVE